MNSVNLTVVHEGTSVPSSRIRSIRQSTDLYALEDIIRHGWDALAETAEAIRRIHDAELYKLTHSRWETYCSERLGISRSRAYQLIALSKVSTMVDTAMPNERVARELSRAPAKEREEVWSEAEELAGASAPTAQQVRTVVERRAGRPKSQQDRRTPRWLFEALSELFGPFVLDAYASPHNALCERFYTREDDGNTQPWEDVTFGNPEFKKMEPAVAKAVEEGKRGVHSILVGPVGGSQAWYHELAIQGTLYIPDVRINFDDPSGASTGGPEDSESGADRDTILMGFGPSHHNPYASQGWFRSVRLPLRDLLEGRVSSLTVAENPRGPVERERSVLQAPPSYTRKLAHEVLSGVGLFDVDQLRARYYRSRRGLHYLEVRLPGGYRHEVGEASSLDLPNYPELIEAAHDHQKRHAKKPPRRKKR